MAPTKNRGVTGARKYLMEQDVDTGVSMLSLGEESDSLSFADNNIEARWKVEGLQLNIQLGSRTLLFVTACLCLMNSPTHMKNARLVSRGRIDMDPVWLALVIGADFTFLLCSSIMLTICLYRPRKYLYYPVMLAWSVYVIVLGFPPWGYLCKDIFKIYLRYPDNIEFRTAANTLECGLQSNTVVQFHMFWLLISPRVIPGLKLMNYNWFWLFVMYISATVWYREHYDEKFFNWNDIGITVGLLALTNGVSIGRKFYMSKSQRSKWIANARQREASEKMFRILEYMVPVHVIVPMLKNPGAVIAEEVSRVSILFIMIVDFDQFTRSLSAEELLAFLNRYFTIFDSICATHEVTKIETVHEEYVAAVGVRPSDVEHDKDRGHADILGRLVTVAAEILKLQSSEAGVQFKMGIHTGPIVAGVIGQKLPRFRLFGDTINTAARMMQKGVDGQLQFGEVTRQELPDWVPVKLRGQIEMKGKGEVTAYLYDREAADATVRTTYRKGKHRVSFELSPSRDAAGSHGSASSFSQRPPISQLVVSHSPGGSVVVPDEGAEEEAMAKDDDEDDLELRPSRRVSLPPEILLARHASAAQEGLATVGVQERLLDGSSPTTKSTGLSPSNRTTQSSQRRASSVRGSILKRSSISGSSLRPSTYSSVSGPSLRNTRTMATEAFVDPYFEEALRELQRAGEDSGSEKYFWPCSLGLNKERFTPETEAKWLEWFHESSIHKKMGDRFDKQERFLVIVTTIELVWMVWSDAAFEEHATYDARLRLPIFLFCRVTSFVILLIWRLLATFRGNGWIKNSPSSVQFWLCISGIVCAALIFFSYDSLSFVAPVIPEDKEHWPKTLEEMRELFRKEYRRGGSVFSLVVVLMYFIASTLHPFRFFHQLSFVVLAAVLVFMDTFISHRLNLAFSKYGRWMFLLGSLVNSFQSLSAEQDSRARYKCKMGLEEAKGRTEKILNTLMPPMVVEDIRDLPPSATLPSHSYNFATIAQSDLVGFTKLASTRTPTEVVEFIGELFGNFDELTDEHGVYKVETVGDAYIAGQAELPLTVRNRPTDVILFGLGMVEKTCEWAERRGLDVKCRVGVHTAECIGGIIGTEMQRYHLFGELMTAVEVLESTAPEGKVQVSSACKEAANFSIRNQGLPENFIRFEERTEPKLTTSKGEVHEYDEVGGRTWVIKGHLRVRGGFL